MKKNPSSFRDGDGYVIEDDCGKIYRIITTAGASNYDQLIESGLYNALISKNLIIEHEECVVNIEGYSAYKVIEPEIIKFISYPYEWSLDQYIDAALLTLEIQMIAVEHGLSLKDGSAYNVQFKGSNPIFIDTLSFEKFDMWSGWKGYKQFCRHFLAPILLMSKVDPAYSKLMMGSIDGVNLNVAVAALPKTVFISLVPLIHLYINNLLGKSLKVKKKESRKIKISIIGHLEMLRSIRNYLKKIRTDSKDGHWVKYYDGMNNYSSLGDASKEFTIIRMLDALVHSGKIAVAADLGSNTGKFTRILSKYCDYCVAIESDHSCAQLHRLNIKKESTDNVLNLVVDIVNPTPSMGWLSRERLSLIERADFDLVISLGLIHHLVVSGGITMDMAVDFYKTITNYLIIEFIPNSDSMFVQLLGGRTLSHCVYSETEFENSFEKKFRILNKCEVVESGRSIYLMEKIR